MDKMSNNHMPRTAPFYPIPSRQLVSVEHPALIKNVDKAIDTLQGNTGISKILNPPRADAPANLLLRPEDAMSRPMQSISSASNNVLLKVTVPKRTGRKRKKGSDEPFSGVPVSTVPLEPRRLGVRALVRSLRDNRERYLVEPVGTVDRTHVFRGMPDFVYSTSESAFTNRFREQILSFDYDKIKQFDLDMSKGATTNVDIIPPPSLSHGDIPFSYIYRQNPTVRQSVDTSGNITTVNTQRPMKVLTHLVPYDIPTVPSIPRQNCPPIDSLDATLQETIAAVTSLFESRPAWTRRGLRNNLTTQEQRYALRHAIPYVGYVFRSGPWRDAIIKLGHDPRSSPDYRGYQTVMFRILPRDPEVARDGYAGRRHTAPRFNEGAPDPTLDFSSQPAPQNQDPKQIPTLTTHLFSPSPPLPRDGRMWMLCDITDPLLASIVFPHSPSPNFLRSTCDTLTDGWYGNGTMAKLKTIMRAKIQSLIDDRVADEGDFVRLLDFPDYAGPGDLGKFMLNGSVAGAREMQLATEVRSTMKSGQGWKGLEGVGGGSKERGKGGRRVQWEDDGDEGSESESESQSESESDGESEGEEAAFEQEEIMEAQAAAAAEGIEGRDRERDPENEGDSEVDETEFESKGVTGSQ